MDETGVVGNPIDGLLAVVDMAFKMSLFGIGYMFSLRLREGDMWKEWRKRRLLLGSLVSVTIIMLSFLGVFCFITAQGQYSAILRMIAWCCLGFFVGFMIGEARGD